MSVRIVYVIGMWHQQRLQKALKLFQKAGGVLRTSDAIKLGIHTEVLYKMRDTGVVEVIIPGFLNLKTKQARTI